MIQKIRIAVLVPMLALTVMGTFFVAVPDAQAATAILFAVTLKDCENTATRVCGARGVASFSYNETTGACSFSCNPPADDTEGGDGEEVPDETEV